MNVERWIRGSAAVICLALGAWGIAPGPATAEADPVTFVAFGDMPYRAEDFARFEDLLDQVNADPPDLVIHVGDIKGGGTPCTDASFARQRDYMNAVDAPLLYTPGDNEWTDCHRPSAGGFDPMERLARLRQMFFAQANSLGARPVPVLRQSEADPQRATYVENLRWAHDGVIFATIHAVGSNDGDDPDIPGAVAEYEARSDAGRAWLSAAFAEARVSDARALVLAFQADPFLTPMQQARFQRLLWLLADEAKAWGGPVLVVHGDGHAYTVDTPFLERGGNPVENVLRLQVPGAVDIRAVRVTVDPSAGRTFTFQPFGPGAN